MRKLIVLAAAAAVALRLRGRRNDAGRVAQGHPFRRPALTRR